MPDFLKLTGGNKLVGEVEVSGAKNAALPLLLSSILSPEECVFRNVPDLEDIAVTLRILKMLGAEASYSDGTVRVRAGEITSNTAPYSLVKAMRASFWVLGPLLARTGEAKVALPGGDAIGTRPVDLHLKGLSQMGADVVMQRGVVHAVAPGKLQSARVILDYPSVGATHHLLLTAALIEGETVIEGAAREPEVVQLAQFLARMGADVSGEGSSVIKICGRESLNGAEIDVLGDRIEAATYLAAGAATGGDVRVSGIEQSMLAATIEVLKSAGCDVEVEENSVRVIAPEKLKAVSFSTAPAPGLATDVQPLLMAAMVFAKGTSVISETVFENRFGHVAEYRRLGADITVDGRIATVSGVDRLSGAPVDGRDIRAAAGMVILGLCAQGVTELYDIYHLDRGYEGLIDKFRGLGADIQRVPAFEDKELVIGC